VDPEDMKFIVDCVIILHNMGINYERGMETLAIKDYEGASQSSPDPNRDVPKIQRLIARHQQIESRAANVQLKNDLVEHIWNIYGSSNVW
jgi:ribosomal protein L31E